jgi:1-aminocyclopropane-1-carboxylate deaminase
MDTISNAAALDDITHWAPPRSCMRLQMLRLDSLHPVISGNKWYKLRYNVAAALALGKATLLTFGGGYSNHLVATAYAARMAGLKSIGIVRGHYADAQITPTLPACEAYGMQLIPSSKAEYASLSGPGSHALAQEHPDAYIIAEGGANEAGIRGAADIAALIPPDVTDVCLAVGTGTTLTGIQSALHPQVRLHGFCAARTCDSAHALSGQVPHGERVRWHSVGDPRFGKWGEEQLLFMKSFYAITGVPLDVVYTAKMMMSLQGMLSTSGFGNDSRIVCIHTGGLQGNPAGLFG